MAKHLKSDQKDPTDDVFFSLLPQNMISKFNADKDNDDFVEPLNKRQQNNLIKTEPQQQLFSNICNYSAQMHRDDEKYLFLSGLLNVDVKNLSTDCSIQTLRISSLVSSCMM